MRAWWAEDGAPEVEAMKDEGYDSVTSILDFSHFGLTEERGFLYNRMTFVSAKKSSIEGGSDVSHARRSLMRIGALCASVLKARLDAGASFSCWCDSVPRQTHSHFSSESDGIVR